MFSPTLTFRHFHYQLTTVSGSLFESLRVFKNYTAHTTVQGHGQLCPKLPGRQMGTLVFPKMGYRTQVRDGAAVDMSSPCTSGVSQRETKAVDGEGRRYLYCSIQSSKNPPSLSSFPLSAREIWACLTGLAWNLGLIFSLLISNTALLIPHWNQTR